MLTKFGEQRRHHYNQLAESREKWLQRNPFFHSELLRFYRFFITKGSSVLQLGCETGDLIGRLCVANAVGVDVSEIMVEIAQKKYPNLEFICADLEDFYINRTFDYIIISGALASVGNIQRLLQNLHKMTTADSRILIDYRNELWAPVLKLGEKAGLKMPEPAFNWLSVDDIENFLEISNYQVIKRMFLLLLPLKIPILSSFVNKFLGKFPIVRRFCLVQTVVSRPAPMMKNSRDLTCSVVLTVRDEEGNIEELIQRIPEMGKHTEIIFVEGHSKDNTVQKIKEIIKKYPEKDIKFFQQAGIGKADATRMGFDKASGDFICILEADLTTPPEEISLLWDAFISGKGELIIGSRFVYEMEQNAMSFLNTIGNRIFGILFTFILEQRFTDALCGLKGISRLNYQKIHAQYDYFGDLDPFGDFELIFGATKIGLKTIEIPVHYHPRTYGQPKAYGSSFISFLKHALLLFRMSWVAFRKFTLF